MTDLLQTEGLVSQADFSRIMNVSRAAVTGWKNRGFLVLVDGQVDLAPSLALLERYRAGGGKPVNAPREAPGGGGEVEPVNAIPDRPQAATPAAVNAPARLQAPPVVETPGRVAGDAGDDLAAVLGDLENPEAVAEAIGQMDWSYEEARRVKETYLALSARLKYDQEARSVVAVADVLSAVGPEYAFVRTKAMAIPAERAPELHRLKTVPEIQDALSRILTECLSGLTLDHSLRRLQNPET